MKYNILFLFTLISSTIYAQGFKPTFYQVSSKEYSIGIEAIKNNVDNTIEMDIPNLKGSTDRYILHPVQVVADEVADQYTIKTYQGYKKGNPNVVIALSSAPEYFSAQVFDNHEGYSLETKTVVNNAPLVEMVRHQHHRLSSCKVFESLRPTEEREHTITYRNQVEGKRTLRLVISASIEYSQKFGGTPYSNTNVLNAIAAGVNSMNTVYKRELGIEFQLVSDHRTIVSDPNNNPFSGGASSRQGPNQTFVSKFHSKWSYDLGHHVAWAETGGSATPGIVCYPGYQAQAASGSTRGVDVLWLDYVVHEIGHQMGAEHNFSSQECGASWDNFRFEPGQGSSIMSYAGLCGSGYTRVTSPHFHYGSINKILPLFKDYFRTTYCINKNLNIGNNPTDPVVNAKNDITIPKETPFILVGNITDADGDPITYQWEQYDGGGGAVPGTPNCTLNNNALFRFRDPVTDRYRCFPQHSDVLAGNNSGVTWEKLPCTARIMNFSLMGRDNNIDYGRIGEDKTVVTVADTGPFEVTSFNSGGTFDGNSYQTVTWSVNGTNAHCPNVDVLISIDGGSNYTEIADEIPNNGSGSIRLPNTNTTSAVILVRCHIDESLITKVRETPIVRSDVADDFRVVSTFYDTGNSMFTIKESSILPVEIVDFKGNFIAQKKQVELFWTTSKEVNNQGFEIQKLVQNNWQSIGFENGYGNTNNLKTYQVTDYNPKKENVYRLKQIDFDGNYSYSSIITINAELDEDVLRYDYLNQILSIDNACPNGILTIYTSEGKIVKEIRKTKNNKLDLTTFPKGLYIVKYYFKNKVYMLKILK